MVKRKKKQKTETDQTYFLKIVLYLILGTFWVRFVNPDMTRQIPIPVGFLIGLLYASHDHFKIDRKIEYAVLVVAMFASFWAQTGLYISVLK